MIHNDSPLLRSLNYYELPAPIWWRLSWQCRGHSERRVHKLQLSKAAQQPQRLHWRRAQGFICLHDVSKDYPDFIEKLDRFRSRYGEQYQLPFDYEPERDDGKGM